MAPGHTEIEASYPSPVHSLLFPPVLPEEMTLIFDISPNYGAARESEQTLSSLISKPPFSPLPFVTRTHTQYGH